MPKESQLISYVFFVLCLASFPLLGISPPKSQRPWLTGPLFAPSARVIPKGHVNLEPYVFWKVVNGGYDKDWNAHKRDSLYQLTTQLVIKGGIYERINVSCIVQSHYKHYRNSSGSGIGDSIFGFDFQLIKEEDDQVPLKLTVQGVFPTGKYQHLSRTKEKTDAMGSGTFLSVIGLSTSKLFHFEGDHFLNTRLSIFAAFPSNVKAKGTNIYGGDVPGDTRASLGNAVSLLCAAEYTLTRNWALALDLNFFYRGKDRIKEKGRGSISTPSNHIEITAAPAIEYNFNEDVGIIIGSWFTLAGRNTEKFVSVAGGLNWYF